MIQKPKVLESKTYFLWSIIGLIILFIFYLYLPHLTSKSNQVEQLNRLLDYSGMEFQDGQIIAWGKIEEPLGVNNIAHYIEDVSQKLCSDILKPETIDQNSISVASTISSKENFLATVKKSEHDPSHYLVLSFTVKDDINSLKTWQTKFEDYFSTLNTKPEVAIEYTGTLNHKFSIEEGRDYLTKLFEEADAKIIEGVSNDELISLTGYTSKIKDYVQAGKNKVNLNMALTYNELEQKTYLSIGSPLLDGEY